MALIRTGVPRLECPGGMPGAVPRWEAPFAGSLPPPPAAGELPRRRLPGPRRGRVPPTARRVPCWGRPVRGPALKPWPGRGWSAVPVPCRGRPVLRQGNPSPRTGTPRLTGRDFLAGHPAGCGASGIRRRPARRTRRHPGARREGTVKGWKHPQPPRAGWCVPGRMVRAVYGGAAPPCRRRGTVTDRSWTCLGTASGPFSRSSAGRFPSRRVQDHWRSAEPSPRSNK